MEEKRFGELHAACAIAFNLPLIGIKHCAVYEIGIDPGSESFVQTAADGFCLVRVSEQEANAQVIAGVGVADEEPFADPALRQEGLCERLEDAA